MTNLVAKNLSYLSPRERERIKVSRKFSQVLGMHSASDFKAASRMSLVCDSTATEKDVALAEKNFWPGIGSLSVKTVRSRPFPARSQVISTP